MTTFNFDEIISRRGTNSYKWDHTESTDVIPLWVADMDFRTAPVIIDALQQRVSHGIFGYTHVPESYYDAVCTWFQQRHGWHIDPGHIIYTSGVVPAISATLKALTQPGDQVIIQSPVYNCFYSSIRNNECQMLDNPLHYENGQYTIDFDDLEVKASQPHVKVLLLCNPHNPAGRVWTREELLHIARICHRHHITIVSDEIHCELTYPGHDYTPFGSLDSIYTRHSVSLVSPSKAFNIAGLQIANIVCPNDTMRRCIDRAININEVCDVNPFGVIATIAAYNQGGPWLDALRQYLYDNYLHLCDHLAQHAPACHVTPLEGTYLAWVDCRSLYSDTDAFATSLLHEAHVEVNPGTLYGATGQGFIRINLACPRSVLHEALNRMTAIMK